MTFSRLSEKKFLNTISLRLKWHKLKCGENEKHNITLLLLDKLEEYEGKNIISNDIAYNKII